MIAVWLIGGFVLLLIGLITLISMGAENDYDQAPVFTVKAAESPHGGRDIPGCSADMKRLAALLPREERK